MDEENNLFDDDDALDYILYEEVNKRTSDGKKGCFGIMVLFILPFTFLGYLFL